jgi:hypothetical protein
MPRFGFAFLCILAAGVLLALPSLAGQAASDVGAHKGGKTAESGLADLCAAIDPTALARTLGITGAAHARADAQGECHVSFDGDRAELDLEIARRTSFGLPPPGREVTAIRGLGDHAVFNEAAGSDGIPTQSLFVLQGNIGLMIQLMRHHLIGPQWHVALARQVLAKLAAKPQGNLGGTAG